MAELYNYASEADEGTLAPNPETEEKPRRRKKTRMNWGNYIVAALLLMMVTGLLYSGAKTRTYREQTYDTAVTAEECNDYITAYETWMSLKGFKDSEQKAKSVYKYACYQYGINAYFAKDYIGAIYWLSQCRDYSDTERMLEVCIAEAFYATYDDYGMDGLPISPGVI